MEARSMPEDQMLKEGSPTRPACTECQRRKQKVRASSKQQASKQLHHDMDGMASSLLPSPFPAPVRTTPQHWMLDLPLESSSPSRNLASCISTSTPANTTQCNREWPCNHCQKRKVADRCSFNHDADQNSAWVPSDDVKRKRERESIDDVDEWDTAAGLEAIGYTSSHILANLEIDVKKRSGAEQYCAKISSSPQLQRALQILPPRQYIDTLVQNFLTNVNYYYYIIYPPNFINEYAEWWKDRTSNRPLGLQWTCLIIMVCACSVQHTDTKLALELEADLGFSVKDLTNQYHNAARELHSAIPVGHGHLFSIQYLLHSCYWFKAEARFVECWQVLGATVREAQALGLHQEADVRISEFDREIRRRLWCIVDSWDWLVSSLLARPMLIDRTDIGIGLPSLTLEAYPVSPLLHLKMQSELVGIIFKRFGPPKILTDHTDIQEYQQILKAFMDTFPPAYAFRAPDTGPEAKYPWVALHRHYMHTCTLSIALGPFRSYMAKRMTKYTPEIELQFRRDGISYALRLMKAVQCFFQYVWSRDTTFHFVPFCIFDTAALLCSAALHDEDGTVSQREDIINAVDLALATLKQLRTATETAKTPYDVLRRLVDRVWEPVTPNNMSEGLRKRMRVADVPRRTSPGSYQNAPAAYQSGHGAPGFNTWANLTFPDASLQPETSSMHSSVLHPANAYAMSPSTDGSTSASLTNNPTVSYASVAPWPQDQYGNQASNGAAVGAAQMNGATGWPGPNPGAPNMFDNVQQTPAEGGLGVRFNILSDVELGDLADLWNWESLDLGFMNNPIL
ncbi:hypothetical protein AK830_g2065 [Neonectria ditissima]|uniref:Xylanolytic transcriptional activator regulatory domain-containing protein n=1 Tax=Neonectria ditissima TaxID=78410 RepID=A0A0N8H8F7_9HYPO|nr:hypothetical protein AK830_g2065 [Neonectria ditissima]